MLKILSVTITTQLLITILIYLDDVNILLQEKLSLIQVVTKLSKSCAE